MTIPKHTRVYMEYFGYQIPEDIPCEITGEPAVDVHHINGRGPGKDVIENLMALNREKHVDCHMERMKKSETQEIHNEFLKRNSPKKKINALY